MAGSMVAVVVLGTGTDGRGAARTLMVGPSQARGKLPLQGLLGEARQRTLTFVLTSLPSAHRGQACAAHGLAALGSYLTIPKRL